jgi:uncharacterized protein YkwD
MQLKKILMLGITGMMLQVTVRAQITSGKDYYSQNDHRNFRNEKMFNAAMDFEKIDFKRINAVVFHLTNEIRVKHNLKPLLFAVELENSSMMHANDMNDKNFFSHINEKDKKKSTPNDRAQLCHVANPMLAENIIEGYGLQYKAKETVYIRGKGQFSSTPDGALLKPHTYITFGEAVITGWMNSKDHRKNMLSDDALQLGCGSVYYVNQKFNDMPSFLVVQNFQLYEPIRKINP